MNTNKSKSKSYRLLGHENDALSVPGVEDIWPSAKSTKETAWICTRVDGRVMEQPVHSSSILCERDEDARAAELAVSMSQITQRSCIGTILDAAQLEAIGNRSVVEVRAGQGFRIGRMNPTDTVVCVTNSERTPNERDKDEVYLDTGLVTTNTDNRSQVAVVDFRHLACDGMRHSNDIDYTPERPNESEFKGRRKMIHAMEFKGNRKDTVHVMIAGYKKADLCSFQMGGDMLIVPPGTGDVYVVVFQFPPMIFTAGIVACRVITMQPQPDGTWYCHVDVSPDVHDGASAPFGLSFTERVVGMSPVNPSARMVLQSEEQSASDVCAHDSMFTVVHEVCDGKELTVEMTMWQKEVYMCLLPSNSNRCFLACVNGLFYLPVHADSSAKPEVIIAAIAAAVHILCPDFTGELPPCTMVKLGVICPLTCNAIKKCTGAVMVLHQVGLPGLGHVSLSHVSNSTDVHGHNSTDVHIPNSTDVHGPLVLWCGVPDEFREELATRWEWITTPQTLYANSGVGPNPKDAGYGLHLQALRPIGGMHGNVTLKGGTKCGMSASKVLHTVESCDRILVIGGSMDPQVIANDCPARVNNVVVVMQPDVIDFCNWKQIAGPASVLLRMQADGSLVWVAGIQGILAGLYMFGDVVEEAVVTEWLQCTEPRPWEGVASMLEVDGDKMMRAVSPGLPFVNPLDLTGCTATTLAELFVASEPVRRETRQVRSIGSLTCQAIQAVLRRNGMASTAFALGDKVDELAADVCMIPPRDVFVVGTLQALPCGTELPEDIAVDIRFMLDELYTHVDMHRRAYSDHESMAHQMQWFDDGKSIAVGMMTDYRFDPPTNCTGDMQDVVAARVAHESHRRHCNQKMLTLGFSPGDVRTAEQIHTGRAKSATSLAKGAKMKANVKRAANWTTSELADYIYDTFDDGGCAVVAMTAAQYHGLVIDGALPTGLTLTTTNCVPETLASLLECVPARPNGATASVLPVLVRAAIVQGNKDEYNVEFVLVIPKEFMTSEPLHDYQLHTGFAHCAPTRIATISGLGDHPIHEKRQLLDHMLTTIASLSCNAAVDDPTEFNRNRATGAMNQLLCMWASGGEGLPFSMMYGLAQPQSSPRIPSTPEDWERVRVLVSLWPGTGWDSNILRSNLCALVARCVKHTLQPQNDAVTAHRVQAQKVVKAACNASGVPNGYCSNLVNRYCPGCSGPFVTQPMAMLQLKNERAKRECVKCQIKSNDESNDPNFCAETDLMKLVMEYCPRPGCCAPTRLMTRSQLKTQPAHRRKCVECQIKSNEQGFCAEFDRRFVVESTTWDVKKWGDHRRQLVGANAEGAAPEAEGAAPEAEGAAPEGAAAEAPLAPVVCRNSVTQKAMGDALGEHASKIIYDLILADNKDQAVALFVDDMAFGATETTMAMSRAIAEKRFNSSN